MPFPFSLHYCPPKPPGSFECRFDPAGKVREGEPFIEWRIGPGYDNGLTQSYVNLGVVERFEKRNESEGPCVHRTTRLASLNSISCCYTSGMLTRYTCLTTLITLRIKKLNNAAEMMNSGTETQSLSQ